MLGLLKAQDMHGYELKKRLADIFGFAAAVSFGSLYPALARLEAAGAVDVVSTTAESGGDRHAAERATTRRRKVYRITPQGVQIFTDLLTSSLEGVEDDRSFNLRLAFAHYLPPDARLGLLERRRVVLGERLSKLALRARAKMDDRYMRILWERQQDFLTRDLSWLDQLIHEERNGNVGGSGLRAVLDDVAAPSAPARGLSRSPVPLASASQLQRRAHGPGTEEALAN